ncbi:MAG TPA: FAD-binding oxidoreductase, partial [Terriglobales bacterium]|nr:FAD-binding oxidoreductase [Terriglobales bacterium]
MQPPLTLVLGVLFVLLAGVNCYLMLRSDRHSNLAAQAAGVRAHRLIGYLFTFLYFVMTYHMVLRLKGLSDELSPRNVIHASLALILLPLLLAKIVVARNYKRQKTTLKILGLSIAGISYLLVIVNLGTYLLRSASSASVPGFISMFAMGASATIFLVLLWYRSRRTDALMGLDNVDRSESRRSSVVLQLVRIQRQTDDAKTLRFLVPRDYRFSFRPGQFLKFNWDIDGRILSRCYSVCSSPLQTGYIEITPKQTASGFVSVFLNQKASVGLTVEASMPAGQFCFDETQHRRIVLIAGGSGITPFMSMLRFIDDQCLPTEVTLLYFVRTRKDIIFHADLKSLQSRLPNFHMLTVLSQPDPGWIGLTGHLTRDLIEINVADIPSCTFFLCGPPAMMKSSREVLETMNVSPTRIKQESFGAAPASTSPERNAGAQRVWVEFARSKQTRIARSSA